MRCWLRCLAKSKYHVPYSHGSNSRVFAGHTVEPKIPRWIIDNTELWSHELYWSLTRFAEVHATPDTTAVHTRSTVIGSGWNFRCAQNAQWNLNSWRGARFKSRSNKVQRSYSILIASWKFHLPPQDVECQFPAKKLQNNSKWKVPLAIS